MTAKNEAKAPTMVLGHFPIQEQELGTCRRCPKIATRWLASFTAPDEITLVELCLACAELGCAKKVVVHVAENARAQDYGFDGEEIDPQTTRMLIGRSSGRT